MISLENFAQCFFVVLYDFDHVLPGSPFRKKVLFKDLARPLLSQFFVVFFCKPFNLRSGMAHVMAEEHGGAIGRILPLASPEGDARLRELAQDRVGYAQRRELVAQVLF